MKRTALVVGLVVVLVSARPRGAPAQDALTLLRSALGGDAAIAAVQTIRARGTIDKKPYKDHFEIAVALPDQFVRTVRYVSVPGLNVRFGRRFDVDSNSPSLAGAAPGIAGDSEEVHVRVTGFNRLMPVPAPSWYELEQHPGDVSLRLDNAHGRLAEFVLPLLGCTPASYPVASRSEAYAINFSAVGGRAWRLELDDVTHLPARMTWSYPLPPTASATAKPRQMQTDFSDFRTVGGVRWPHRLMTRTNGEISEDARIDRYEQNVKLSGKVFRK